jgi:hypothetical protein
VSLKLKRRYGRSEKKALSLVAKFQVMYLRWKAWAMSVVSLSLRKMIHLKVEAAVPEELEVLAQVELV